jgi:hypothetical protein
MLCVHSMRHSRERHTAHSTEPNTVRPCSTGCNLRLMCSGDHVPPPPAPGTHKCCVCAQPATRSHTALGKDKRMAIQMQRGISSVYATFTQHAQTKMLCQSSPSSPFTKPLNALAQHMTTKYAWGETLRHCITRQHPDTRTILAVPLQTNT